MSALKKEEEAIVKAFAEAKRTCTVPYVLNYSRPIPSINLRLHHLLMILGGVASIVNILIAIYLIIGHLSNWVKPREQKQCVRIIFILIFLSVVTFCSLAFYNASGFIDPIGQYYEGFAIVALYLLYCSLTLDDYPNKAPKYPYVKHEICIKSDSRKQPTWLARSWILVFQILMTRVVTVVASEVLFGTQCPLSKARTEGQLAITALQSVSTGMAVAGVYGYERRTRKRHLQAHRPALKFISFKAVVILQATQEIIFRALGETKTFFPTAPFHVSYNDFTKGIPDVLLLWELMVMALLFLKAFNANEYRDQARSGALVLRNPVTAFLSCFIPTDYVVAFASLCSPAKKEALRNDFDGKDSTVCHEADASAD